MTKDDADYESFLSGLNVKEASEKLSGKVPEPKCPFCGSVDWSMESNPLEIALGMAAPTFVMKDTRPYHGPTPSIPTLSLSCENCGFVRQHNIPILNGKTK